MLFVIRGKNPHKTQFVHHFEREVRVSCFSWERARAVSSTKSGLQGSGWLSGILPWPDASAAGWQDVAKQGRVCGRCIWQEQQSGCSRGHLKKHKKLFRHQVSLIQAVERLLITKAHICEGLSPQVLGGPV